MISRVRGRRWWPSAALVLIAGLALNSCPASPTWSLEALPSPAGSARALLHDISCTSPTACMAVGYRAAPSSLEYTLSEVRSGSTWRVVTTPNPSTSIASVLSGVACSSATSCVTVGLWTNGSDLQFPLAEVWNGTTWAMSGPPLPAGATSGSLNGVACTSASWCAAVGTYIANHGVEYTLAEAWNGKSWALRSAPSVSRAVASSLSSVACTSTTACKAVGSTTSATGTTVPLAEAWNGVAWAIVPTAVPSGTASHPWAELLSIACPGATSCVATGDYALNNASPFAALAELWNGTSWKLSKPVIPAGTSRSPLTGVSCPAATSCTAVGFAAGATRTTTLAESWNGSTWQVEVTPNPSGATLADLYGVACRSTSACTAAGFAGTGGVDHPLGETTDP